VLGTSRPVARYCAAAGNDPSTWKVINEAFVEGPATNCAQSFWATLTPVDLAAQAAVIAARQNQMTIQQWTATLNAKLAATATIQDVQNAVTNLVTLGVLTTDQGTEVTANVAAARGIATT
jgi:Lon protease-like protein